MADATAKLGQPWVLWYHDPASKDYSIKGYVRIAEVTTIQQFWTLVDSIQKEAWECGMFFFMKGKILPMWDAPENEHGGTWSKKIEISKTYDAFIDLMVHCITDELMNSKNETLVGLTLSPKGQFHIFKIWNTLSSISKTDVLNQNMTFFPITDDVVYTPHKARPK